MKFLWVLFNSLLNLTILCKNMRVPHLCKRFLSCAYLMLISCRAQYLLRLFLSLVYLKQHTAGTRWLLKEIMRLICWSSIVQFLFLLQYQSQYALLKNSDLIHNVKNQVRRNTECNASTNKKNLKASLSKKKIYYSNGKLKKKIRFWILQ